MFPFTVRVRGERSQVSMETTVNRKSLTGLVNNSSSLITVFGYLILIRIDVLRFYFFSSVSRMINLNATWWYCFFIPEVYMQSRDRVKVKSPMEL